MAEDISDEEARQIVRNFNKGSHSAHSFLQNVASTDNTTKLGNLSQEELGEPNLPLRVYKELEIFCKDIGKDGKLANYFSNMAEVATSTSLSKKGFLDNLAVTKKQTKQLADVSPPKKENKGWFKKGEKQNE